MSNEAPGQPVGPSISYSLQYRRCGKPRCLACGAGGRGHGPYWYAFWYEEGRKRSRYLGKKAPPAAGLEGDAGQGARAAGRLRAGSLRVATLGAFSVWLDGEHLPPRRWRRRKVAALFKCLLGAPGHRLLREQLVDALFPDRDPARAARALRSTTYLLRKILDRPGATTSHVRGDGDWLALAPQLDADPPPDWLDADVFDRAVDAALSGKHTQACTAALALYHGDYLPDDRYEDWSQPRRDELRLRRIAVLLHLTTLYQMEGAAEEALRCLRAVLSIEATNEDAARALMRALAGEGRYGEAFQVYRDLSAVLAAELDDEPTTETRALRATLIKALPAPVMAPPRKGNLPAALTSFVGRERERAELFQALRPGSGGGRLLTLLGAGGCGKTRLALEAARALVDEYADGAWLVELAQVTAGPGGIAPHVPEAVADALGVRVETSCPALESLIARLAPMRMLLLLDNCEHLIDSCGAMVTALLAAAPNLRVLVTSQIPLGVLGETCLRVPSLSLPGEQRLYDPAELATYEAIALFVERARAGRHTFELTSRNAGAVVRICRQLDGIPLALELAAVRLSSLPLETIEARLVDRFRLLSGGNRASVPRQQTLQATLDWSYGLLNATEQHLLRRLSVFAGGWDLAAAEAIVGEDAMSDWELLDIMEGLVTKSLVQFDDIDGAPRFRLLETVRHYARRHLDVSGEAPVVSDRHLQWYVSLAETLREALRAPEQAEAAARLGLERDNTIAALHWARERGAQSLGLRLAVAMRRHWEMRGHLTEGREWLDMLLSIDAPEEERAAPSLCAQAFNAGGLLAFGQGDYRQATARHEQSLALLRGLGDVEDAAATLNNLGNIAVRTGDYTRASALYYEALTHFKGLQHDGAIATVLNNLGSIAGDRGDQARATAFYDESLAIRRGLGDVAGIAESLANLGHVAFARGDPVEAEDLLGESLALRRAIGDTGGVGESLRMLAQVALGRGDRSLAGDLFRESLALCRQADDLWGSAACLLGLAAVSASLERFEDSIVFRGVADALRRRIGAALAPADRETDQRLTAMAREALGEAAFAAVLARARVLTPEVAIAQVLEPSGR